MSKRAAHNSATLGLRARWALLLLLGVLVIIAGRALLYVGWPASAGDAWALLAIAVFLTQLSLLWFDLPQNTSLKSRRLLPGFGPGTWVSLLRVLALALLAGFLWPPRPEGWLAWVPLVLYLFFNLADLADGFFARVSGTATTLGGNLDLQLDGRGLLVATLLTYHYGAVGRWFLLVGLARYMFVFAAWVHRRLGGTFELRPNSLRRPLAGAQMGIGVALLAPQLPKAVTLFASAFSFFPFVGNFFFDWLAASGWLRIRQSAQQSKARETLLHGGLLLTRVALTFSIFLRVTDQPFDAYSVLDIFLGFVLLLGLVGRLAAFALLVETGIRLQGQAVQTMDSAILTIGMVLLYLGAGAVSWRPLKEGWIFRHWGARG